MGLIKDTDGIAMTEGIIVIPFFIAVWLGMFSLYCYYTASLSARGAATHGAYSQAMNGECDNTSFNSDPDAPATGFAGNDDADATHAIDEYEVTGDSGIWNAAKDVNPLIFQHVRSSATVTHEVYGRPREADASRIMLCNTRPIKGVLDLIIDSIKGFIGID